MKAVPGWVLTGTAPGTELTGKHCTDLEISLMSTTQVSECLRAVAPKPALHLIFLGALQKYRFLGLNGEILTLI